MSISDEEIALRKALFRITDEDEAILASFGEAMLGQVDRVVDAHIAGQVDSEAVSMIVGDRESLRRLHLTMRDYVLQLFGGDYGAGYVAGRLRVGRVHQQHNVPAQLYVSSMKQLSDLLDDALARVAHPGGKAARAHGRDAVHRLLLFDAQLVFDTYIRTLADEVQVSRQQIERHATDLEAKVVERTRRLEDLARRDALTGLMNRRSFFERIERELSAARRYAYPLSLVYVDLNGFKGVNDSLGHQTGDAVLTQVGEAIGRTIRGTDFAARYGGDEFCIVLPHATVDSARSLCARLIDRLDRRSLGPVTMSMGIAQTGPDDVMPAEVLVQIADAAMYEAKRASRDAPGHCVRVSRWVCPVRWTQSGGRSLASDADEPVRLAGSG